MTVEGVSGAALSAVAYAAAASRPATGIDLRELDQLKFKYTNVINSAGLRPELAKEIDAELASTPLRADSSSTAWTMCNGRPVRGSTQAVFAVAYVDDVSAHYYLCEPGAGLADSRFACATLEYSGDDDASRTLYLSPWQSWEAFEERYLLAATRT